MKRSKDWMKQLSENSRYIITIGICVMMLGAFTIGVLGTFNHYTEKTAAKKSEQAFESKVTAKQQELKDPVEPYAPDSIVLSNTSKERATALAKKLGAEVRLTKEGDFATLYLPEGTTIEDVYADEQYAADILEMTPDYKVSTTAVDALGRELMAVRPQYVVDDSDYNNQSYLDYLDMQDVWNGTKGSGVKIAVIDTGIDTDNPEFEGRISDLSYVFCKQ